MMRGKTKSAGIMVGCRLGIISYRDWTVLIVVFL
jgi:hypothetical protein